MRRHRLISTLPLVALVAGCAGPGGRIGGSGSGEEGWPLLAARELSGTRRGSYWQLGMMYYDDDADCTLRIKEDATFTATCTRSPVGTNNIARSSKWSGRVVTKGNRIVLQDNGGPWPSIVLRRSGKDALYGVTLDPPVGATVEMNFEREPNTAAGTGSN